MIPILDAADAAEVRLPLWSDPAVTAANDKAPLREYMLTGDASVLNLEPETTVAVVRALSAKEMDAAERAAGRRPHFGAVVAQRKRLELAEVDLDSTEGAERFAKWRDALTDEETVALAAFEAWEAARFVEVGKAGCVRISHPSRDFSLPEFLAATGPLAREIGQEVGFRVQQLSGLGERPKGLSDSAFGLLRLPESAGVHGDATSADPSEDDSAATVAAPSPLT